MATLGRFVWHELMTSDIAAAQAFYGEVIGWGVRKFDSPDMEYYAWLANGVAVGGLMKVPDEAAKSGVPPMWVPYMQTPDAKKTEKQIEELGGHAMRAVYRVPAVGWLGIMKDPQGAVFAIIAPEPGDTPETDPKPLEFSWHELITTDMEAGHDFYKKIFGWKDTDAMDMGKEMGIYQMFGRDRFTYGGMMKKPPQQPGPSQWLSYTLVDDADAAALRATKAGGTVINGPMEVPGGDRIATMLDPQGAMFSVHSKAKK